MRGMKAIKVRNGKCILDETNMRILDELNDNARITMTELGNVVGLHRLNATARVENMEAAGIIEGYTVVINWNKIDNGGK